MSEKWPTPRKAYPAYEPDIAMANCLASDNPVTKKMAMEMTLKKINLGIPLADVVQEAWDKENGI